MKKLIFNFFLCILFLPVFAQNDAFYIENYFRYDNYIYKDEVLTVDIYNQADLLSYPVFYLGSEYKLIVNFDVLGNEQRNYSYKIIHCNASWQPSDLFASEYIEGYEENNVWENVHSFNTSADYIHYSFNLPNNDINITKSGNYLLKVYEDYNEENVVFTRRFYVVDNKTEIQATVKQPTLPQYYFSGHEIDFTIKPSVNISNPLEDLKIVISQNGRTDNVITGLTPTFINDQQLTYDYNKENVFPAGNEFRFFDLEDLKYRTEYIDSIYFQNPYYDVFLNKEYNSPNRPHNSWKDINGQRVLRCTFEENCQNESEYVYVNFYLPVENEIIDGNIYVLGELTDWQFTKRNLMIFNPERNAYELTLMLKQGYYNYQYAIVKDQESAADITTIEGSTYETENNYLIFVYYCDLKNRYDELIGFQIFTKK